MRTKTLLLAAAATLAAGLITSQAQVYSANIVGYANVNIPANQYSLIANPLQNGDGTNGASNVLPPFMISTPGNDNQYDDFLLLTYSAGHYTGYQYDQDTGWMDFTGSTPVPQPTLAPGQGFYIYNVGATTNITFTGTVVPNPSGTNTLNLPVNSYALVGSPLAVGGTLDNNTNLNFPLQDGGQTYLLFFSAGHYTGYTYDTGVNPSTGWADFSDSTPVSTPTLSVGQGFFYLNLGSATNWVQTLNNN